MRRSSFHLILLSAFLLLTLILTFPLVTQMTTHVPGSYLWAFDEYTFVWNIWWFKHALLQLNWSPLATDFIFYPVGVSFALYTFTLFNAALALPLVPFLPLPLVSNLLTLCAFTLSGYGTYLLARWQLMELGVQSAGRGWREGAAIVAGIGYAFTTSKFMSAAIGHYNFMGTQWIPFCLLYFLRALKSPARRDAVMCGLFLALAMYVEMNFGVFLVMFMLIYTLAQKVWRSAGWRNLLAQGTVIGVTGALIFLPVLAPVMGEFIGADYTLKGWGDALKLSVDLAGFVSPGAISTWAGLDWNREQMDVIQGKGRFADVNTVFLGYATLAFALIGLVARWHHVRVWGLNALIFAVCALGPLLQINGISTFDFDGLKVNFPMPFVVFHYIPIVQANRVPNRFSVVLVLCLAMLAGYAVMWLAEKLRHRGNALLFPSIAVISLLMIADHLVVPLPLTDARVPAFYMRLAQETEDYSILQLPLGWRNSFGTLGAEDTRVQYYQSAHQKRILGGNTSRNHPFKFEYYQSLPIVSSLLLIEDYKPVPPEHRAFDRAYADEFVRFFDLRYVVVHPAIPGRKPYDDTREAALRYLLDVLPLEPVSDTGDLLVYRVRSSPLPDKQGIDFGEPTSRPYRGEGWDREEEIAGTRANWANATRARVFTRVNRLSDHRLTFAALPFTFPGAPQQTATLVVNQQVRLPPIVLQEGWRNYTARVPASALRPGLNEIVFEFAYTRAPRDVIGSDDPRALAVAVDWIEWSVE